MLGDRSRPAAACPFAEASPPVASTSTCSLVIVGHQFFSTCSITRSVPRSCGTNGLFRGLYIVSVRSRTSTTFFPSFRNCRMPNGRPRMHMLAWTPQTMTLSMPRCWRRFHTSRPSALMASPGLMCVMETVGHNKVAINIVWTLIWGFLVMFMQAGFAAVETGFTRREERGPHVLG